MQLHTYKEWQSVSRQVIKGSRSVGRNEEGIPVFRLDQTKSTDYNPYGDENDAELYADEEEHFLGSHYLYDMGDR